MKKKLFTAEEATEVVENDIAEDVLDTEVKVEKVEEPTPVEGVVEIKPEPKKTTVGVKIGKVTATSLNIRADASLTAPVVRVVPINTELKIIDETSDFFLVEGPDNTRGFCKKDFIAVK
jgi:hypothetical protein